MYRALTLELTLQDAVTHARHALLTEQTKAARDWHLARVFLGPQGGGQLIQGARKRHNVALDAGHKEFLDLQDSKVPVAGRREFVGRRRQIQQILRAFREREHPCAR